MKIIYKYKKALVVLSIISIPFLFGNLYSTKYIIKSTGSHPGSTGAPGDVTCKHSGCHADATVFNPAVGVNTLVFPTLDSSYVPGQTYTIDLKVQKANITRFGFELCALDNTLNQSAGTFSITDVSRIQEITHTLSGSGDIRTSLTHLLAGTPFTPTTGKTNWSFQWTAPATNVGKITFYYCVNCTNNNSANTGDALYLNSFVIHPALANNISQFIDESNTVVYFEPTNKEINVSYLLKTDKQVSIKITDVLGKEVRSISQSKVKGNNTEKISMDNMTEGVYIVNLSIDNTVLSKKILVR